MEFRKSQLLPVSCLIAVLTYQIHAQPKIQFPKGTSHDFGNIYRGQNATHLFELKNAGTDTLVIKGVSSSCGCTAALVSSSRIPPDSGTQVRVTFSSGGYVGIAQKTVTVTSNDPTAPVTTIIIKSNILQVLEQQPSQVFFASAKIDSLATSTVQLKNVTEKPLRILTVQSHLEGLNVVLEKKALKPGESAELKAAFKPKHDGYNFGNVILTTDFQPQSEVVVNVSANVRK